MQNNMNFLVAALYRFGRIEDPQAVRDALFAICEREAICGTLLIAKEGVNGTIAGGKAQIETVLDALREITGFETLELKFSHAAEKPFLRLKVRVKKEIVTMGVEDIDPTLIVGTYVDAGDWNDLIADPNTVVIDTRNDYEVRIGTFEGAVDPDTQSFGEFPDWVEAHRDELEGKNIAMFCTGGIRCEKATAYVRNAGFDNVFHLKGGILKYLEDMPEEGSLWKGECFVFDERVSVGHGLKQGEAEMCRACRHPVLEIDRADPRYEEGVSCPRCFEERSEADRARFAERQKQIRLAAERGTTPHIGPRAGASRVEIELETSDAKQGDPVD